MNSKTKECCCVDDHILLYGIVSFDYVDKQFFLHSVDRTREQAVLHQDMIREEYRMNERRAIVRIETFKSDHAFAKTMQI